MKTCEDAILKPKKPVDYPRRFRPISSLSCLCKPIERITLFCIDMIIDQMLSMEQAGFRLGRDSTEQVLALNSFVEAGFEKQLKTGTVFFYLSAAYDTVWYNGLMLKLIKIIKCKKTLKLLKRMTGPRYFTELLGGGQSMTKTIKTVSHRNRYLQLHFSVYTLRTSQTQALKIHMC